MTLTPRLYPWCRGQVPSAHAWPSGTTTPLSPPPPPAPHRPSRPVLRLSRPPSDPEARALVGGCTVSLSLPLSPRRFFLPLSCHRGRWRSRCPAPPLCSIPPLPHAPPPSAALPHRPLHPLHPYPPPPPLPTPRHPIFFALAVLPTLPSPPASHPPLSLPPQQTAPSCTRPAAEPLPPARNGVTSFGAAPPVATREGERARAGRRRRCRPSRAPRQRGAGAAVPRLPLPLRPLRRPPPSRRTRRARRDGAVAARSQTVTPSACADGTPPLPPLPLLP